jgi:hypothetical protein
VVTAVLVIGASDDDETTSVAIRSNTLVLIDPEEDRVVDAVALNGTPTRLTYGDGARPATRPSEAPPQGSSGSGGFTRVRSGKKGAVAAKRTRPGEG